MPQYSTGFDRFPGNFGFALAASVSTESTVSFSTK